MTQETADRLEREVFIAAPPETVFGYLTEPEKMIRWMGIEVALDPRPGGIYRCNVDGENIAAGSFVEVSAPERVVILFGWEGGEMLPPGQSTVEITLTRQDSGTLLRLVHSGLPTDMVESHGEGWDHFVARLAIAGAGEDPGPDPWVKTPAA